VVLEQVADTSLFLAPVPALRVNRQNTQHVLLVGDKEKTNHEMNEWLKLEAGKGKKRAWWIIALVIAVLSLGILAWHFYSNGWSIGNQLRL
jgi:hypothetical protein